MLLIPFIYITYSFLINLIGIQCLPHAKDYRSDVRNLNKIGDQKSKADILIDPNKTDIPSITPLPKSTEEKKSKDNKCLSMDLGFDYPLYPMGPVRPFRPRPARPGSIRPGPIRPTTTSPPITDIAPIGPTVPIPPVPPIKPPKLPPLKQLINALIRLSLLGINGLIDLLQNLFPSISVELPFPPRNR